MTKKELNLIKGSLRRVFGRSDLRRDKIQASIRPDYKDSARKAVKFWIECTNCGTMEAKSNIELDHKVPVVPLDRSFEEMSVDEVIDRMWCDPENLEPLCHDCHKEKTKIENAERRRLKKERGIK